MLSFKEYENIALKLISSYKKKCGNIQLTDELIGSVIRFMSVADWKYNHDRLSKRFGDDEEKSRYKWRQIRGVFAIREYVKHRNNRSKKFISLENYNPHTSLPEYNENTGKKIKFLINNSGLTKEQEIVINHYLEGMDMSAISNKMGISSKQCKNLYDSAIIKIRRLS